MKLGLLDAYPQVTGPYGQDWVCDFWELTRTEDGERFDACLPNTQLPPGHYTLDIYPPPSEALPYRFGFELHTVDAELNQTFTGEVTPTQPWTVVSDPSTGQGTLNSIGDSDHYSFTTDQFGTLNFAITCDGAAGDRCPSLSVTDSAYGWVYPDHLVARPGSTYTVTVSGGDGGVHDYGLTVSMSPPVGYEIGETVSEGSSGPGTGVFNTGRDNDLYAFEVPPGGQDVNIIGTGHTSCWAIPIYVATTGEAVDTQCWAGSVHLTEGDYVAVLSANDWYNDEDLPYSFVIRQDTEPQTITLDPGTDAAPTTETRTLSTSADQHLYNFTVPEDGDYTVTSSGPIITEFVATPPSVDYVDTSSPRVHLTPGDYQVLISADSDSIVDIPYTLAINTAPAPDTGDYTLGDTLTPSTGSGLGVLETGGSLDQLTFSLAAATPLALSLAGIPCSDLTLNDAAGTTSLSGCDFDWFSEVVPPGDYTISIAPAWGEASDGPVPYSLTLRINPGTTSEGEVSPVHEHEHMPPNVVSTINNTLDVQSFVFHVSADDQNTQNFLILEQGVGCQTYRIVQTGTVLAQGACENSVLWYPQEGDYQLQVTGNAADEFTFYLYLAGEIPDGFIWPGSGGGAA